MLIRIGPFDITECWDGVFYKKLSQYPKMTAWEIQTVLDFIRYEQENGRDCKIEADKEIIEAIHQYRSTYDRGVRVHVPPKIEECIACPKYRGCMTRLCLPYIAGGKRDQDSGLRESSLTGSGTQKECSRITERREKRSKRSGGLF